MENLPHELTNYIIAIVHNTCDVSFVMLSYTSKQFYEIVDQHTIDHRIKKLPIVSTKNIVTRGYLNILQELYKLKIFIDGYYLYRTSAEYGHLHIMKWARQNCYYLNTTDAHICSSALEKNNFELLEWARNQGCIIPHQKRHESLENFAKRTGNVELYKWIRSRDNQKI